MKARKHKGPKTPRGLNDCLLEGAFGNHKTRIQTGNFHPRVNADLAAALMRIFVNCASLFTSMVAVISVGRMVHAAKTTPRFDASGKEQRDWPAYGGGPENNHYSRLAQINRSNVKRLTVAWSFDTQEEGELQTSPIIVEGVLYGITPTQKVFALDAANGKLLWKVDSDIRGPAPARGLAYWADGKDKRILVGVMNFLYALDAATGKPIPAFPKEGLIDLRENLGREPASAQSIDLTSPAVIYKDLVIVGGRNPETLPAPPRDIRAYDARTW